MDRTDKILSVIIAIIMIFSVVTWMDIMWHQDDGMYGGETVHTLPTTRALARAIENWSE